MLMAFSTFANEKPDGKFDFEKFKAEKIAYITNALSLTPKEAEVFWPVYNEFEGKKWRLSPLTREIMERKGVVRPSGAYNGYKHWAYEDIILSEV